MFWIDESDFLEIEVEEFWLKPGDRVCHVKDPELTGEVIQVDYNLLVDEFDSTTCLVLWDGGDIGDVQWTNKLDILGSDEE